MGQILLFCFFTFLPGTLLSQDMKREKRHAVDSLLALTTCELKNVNPVGGMELATEALSESRQIHYSTGQAKSCFFIGQVLNYMGKYEKSLEYLLLAEQEKCAAKDPALLSEISRIKGQVYFYLGLKNAAFAEFEKAYRLVRQIPGKGETKDRLLGIAYENMSIAYNIIKENADSAWYYVEKNRDLLNHKEDSVVFKNKINLYTIMGEHFVRREQFDSAGYYYDEALRVASRNKYPYISWVCAHWGDLYLQKADPDSALVYYRKALDNLNTTGLKNELPALYQKMTEIYTEKGEKDSAHVYEAKSAALNNELALSKGEAVEKALQILLSEEQQYAREKHRRVILAIAVALFFVLAVLLFFWLHWTKKKKEKLLSKENELLELKRKLNDSFDDIIALAKTNDPSFTARFSEAFPAFTHNIYACHPSLTPSEFFLCAMIFLNFSSKDIANYTFIEHRSVQTRKSRLRKKLEMASDVDLFQYMKSFSR